MATDPEEADQDNIVTWDLSGADAALFDLSQDGVLTFNASPNYEKPGDADKDNTYEVTVGAKDADESVAPEDVEVKVTNVDEDGTVTLSAVQPRVGVSLTASLTDIDGPVTGVKWQWSNYQKRFLRSKMPRRTPTRRLPMTMMGLTWERL